MIRMNIWRNERVVSDELIQKLTAALYSRSAAILQDDSGQIRTTNIDIRVHNQQPLDRSNFDLAVVVSVPDNSDQRFAHQRHEAELRALVMSLLPDRAGHPPRQIIAEVQLELTMCDSSMIKSEQRASLHSP